MNCSQFDKSKNSAEFLKIESQNVSIDSATDDDSNLVKLIAPYRQELEEKMNIVIGISEVSLKKGKPEAPLNNFVADLMRKQASREMQQPIDIALTNLGGLRTDIPKGIITLGKVYEVMPFENELVVIYLRGAQVRKLAREIGALGGEPLSGMRLTFEYGKLIDLTIGGNAVENEKNYSLVTTDYLTSPGRQKLSILGTVPRIFLGVTLRQAIIDEVIEINGRAEKISVRRDDRIIIK
jgi:2',3'-cyclic-nucleotide 2'-phosphodiesterase (5'-nucleotidase family)